jgi:hypothetical protein
MRIKIRAVRTQVQAIQLAKDAAQLAAYRQPGQVVGAGPFELCLARPHIRELRGEIRAGGNGLLQQ